MHVLWLDQGYRLCHAKLARKGFFEISRRDDQGEIAQVFVANVLSGTVTRIDLRVPENGNPTVQAMTQIA